MTWWVKQSRLRLNISRSLCSFLKLSCPHEPLNCILAIRWVKLSAFTRLLDLWLEHYLKIPPQVWV